MMKGLFFLAIICITSVKAGVFCNPYFLEIPRVTQVDIQTVYLSWNISCWLDCCPTYFVVKYWEHKYTINTCFPHPTGRKYAYCLKPKPDWKYQYTEHINSTQFYTTINVTSEVEYMFEVVSIEDNRSFPRLS